MTRSCCLYFKKINNQKEPPEFSWVFFFFGGGGLFLFLLVSFPFDSLDCCLNQVRATASYLNLGLLATTISSFAVDRDRVLTIGVEIRFG